MLGIRRIDRRSLGGVVLALGVGAAGGAVFAWFDLPLAWMIGALVATTAASLGGLGVRIYPAMRAAMIAVLGVMLGSAFTPELLSHALGWLTTISALVVYVVAVGALTALYFRHVAGYDRVTAYFAGAPGGLMEMTLIGGALGGDDRTISLAQSARVLLIVLVVPFAFRFGTEYDAGRRAAADVSVLDVGLVDVGILALTGIAGLVIGRAVRSPAALLTGPMLASAAAHMTGLTASRPPIELIAVAQVVVGAAIGCRFAGLPLAHVLRTLWLAGGATAIMLAMTALFALGLARLSDTALPALFLAFAPGGLAEMSLIALALGIDAAFVASHHVVRIIFVVVLAPLVFRLSSARRL